MAMNSPTPKVQLLYDLCKSTFTPSGFSSASSQPVHKLCSLLDTFGPADVGLKEESPDDDRGHGFFGLNRICIFCFPTSSVIPLHDHPGMTVFSKVLYGSLHVKAYDWVEPACIKESRQPGYPQVRLARLAVDKVLTAPCSTSVLFPKTGGNLHCFTAITPCAVLDVLAPPYREDIGRRCTYYMDYPYSTFGNGAQISSGKEEEYAWLAETSDWKTTPCLLARSFSLEDGFLEDNTMIEDGFLEDNTMIEDGFLAVDQYGLNIYE
ncbi:hypothetical protein COLO4_08658 [Corchorus olitorius]|uniref:cysteine dioxygenase n=1 Tax=Corchorus olitorius TaxID=93759 RepID=A0A1R3KF06_9ROSI|nr:hypothetical protein COLO4_08658 [Corchorus olitorius]